MFRLSRPESWNVFGNGKTALRCGVAMFSDQPPYLHITDITAGNSEKMQIEAKGEVTNLFNRANLVGVNSDLSNSLFAHSVNQLPARYLQLHLRASF